MGRYVLHRVLMSIPTVIGVSIMIFLVMRILPGDPVSVVFGQESFAVLSRADQARFRAELGLDKPYYLQYLDWVTAVVHGDLGRSFWQNDTIGSVIRRRGPLTIQIGLMATVISMLVGLPVGIMSAVRRNSWQDNVGRVFAALFLAIPSFWMGVIIILIGVIYFSWRPPIQIYYLWSDPVKNLQMTIGPAIALGLSAGAYIARMTRSSVLEVLGADFVRTANAKGLRQRVILWRHVLSNAILPVMTLSGLIMASLLGGSVAVEAAFEVPGLGTYLVQSLADRDYMVVQNLVLLYAIIFTLVNLLVDIAYGWLDPRIRPN